MGCCQNNKKAHLAGILFICSLAFLLISFPQNAKGQVTFSVSFNDPGAEFSAFYSVIESHTLAAANDWVQYFEVEGEPSIEIEVAFNKFETDLLATGGAANSAFVRNDGTRINVEPNSIFEIRTGIDLNETRPDGFITISINSLTNGELWFDPNPTERTDSIPFGSFDAYSTILHEFGHIFGIAVFINETTGELPAHNIITTYDELINFDGTNFFFTGPMAMMVYGGPVPLTFGSISHVGNSSPRPGEVLLSDLMAQFAFSDRREKISDLDLAILGDIGVNLVGSGDQFEPNNSFETATELGIINEYTENDLSIHVHGEEDYYRLTTSAKGRLNVSILFSQEKGDLDLLLYDGDLNEVTFSGTDTDNEHISLVVGTSEIYFLRILGFNGATRTSYNLVIEILENIVDLELTKLTASDGAPGDLFGKSTAISGNTLVVGADSNDDKGSDSGSAYIFERDQGGSIIGAKSLSYWPAMAQKVTYLAGK